MFYSLAAEQGYAEAQFNLAKMYHKGDGVPQYKVYAYMWGHIAASSGDKDGFDERDEVAKKMTPAEIAEAEKLVSECVAKKYKGCQSTTTESATVATESPSTALSEARSLAEQGDADAQFNLGEMYEWG